MFTVSDRLNVPGCVIAVIGGGEYGAGRIEYIIVGLCCTLCISTLITYCIAMCYIFIVVKSHIRSKAGWHRGVCEAQSIRFVLSVDFQLDSRSEQRDQSQIRTRAITFEQECIFDLGPWPLENDWWPPTGWFNLGLKRSSRMRNSSEEKNKTWRV